MTQKDEKHHFNLDLSIIGKKFHKLTVLNFEFSKNGTSYWNCQCDCGNIKIINGKSFRYGTTRSCGCECKKGQVRPLNTYPDLTNQNFGELFVIKRTNKKRNGCYLWKCKCSCGKTKYVTTSNLNTGKTKSCGHLQIKSQLIDLVGQKFGNYTVLERVYNKIGGDKVRGKWKCRCDCGAINFLSIFDLKKKKSKYCQECRDYYGENNGNYNPELTDEERFFTRENDPKARKWRKDIYTRDNYTCQITGIKGNGDLCAHHLESWHANKNLRYDLTNGITILECIHINFHRKYGIKNNTKQQFEEFAKNLTKKEIKQLIKQNERRKKRKTRNRNRKSTKKTRI